MIPKIRDLHPLWLEYQRTKTLDSPVSNLIGKWYYTYTNTAGDFIELVKKRNEKAYPRKKWIWECDYHSKLGRTQFSTQAKAERAIYKALEI